MGKFNTQLHRLAKLIGLIGILKDFFGDEEKLKKIYRVLMGGLIAYIIGKTVYMSYKVFTQGFVKEIHRRVDDDGENEGDYIETPDYNLDLDELVTSDILLELP